MKPDPMDFALEIDPKEFALSLMKYYDPHTYEMVFMSDDQE